MRFQSRLHHGQGEARSGPHAGAYMEPHWLPRRVRSGRHGAMTPAKAKPLPSTHHWHRQGSCVSVQSDSVNRRILVINDNVAAHQNFRKILARPLDGETALAATQAPLFGEVPAVARRFRSIPPIRAGTRWSGSCVRWRRTNPMRWPLSTRTCCTVGTAFRPSSDSGKWIRSCSLPYAARIPIPLGAPWPGAWAQTTGCSFSRSH